MEHINVHRLNVVSLNRVHLNVVGDIGFSNPKPVHDGHYITLDGLRYKTSDGKYYSVKA